MERNRFKSAIKIFDGRVVIYEVLDNTKVVSIKVELQNKDKERIYTFRTLHELAVFLGYSLKKTSKKQSPAIRNRKEASPIVEFDKQIKEWPISLSTFYMYVNRFRQALFEQRRELVKAGLELAIQDRCLGDIWDDEKLESPYGTSIEGEDLRIV